METHVIVQLPLTSPPVFGTEQFGKVRAWNPKCVYALFSNVCVHVCIRVCVYVCLFVIKIMAVQFYVSLTLKNLYTFSFALI